MVFHPGTARFNVPWREEQSLRKHAQEDRKAMERTLKIGWKLGEKMDLLGWILRAGGITMGVLGLSRQRDQGEPDSRKCKGCPGSSQQHRGRVKLSGKTKTVAQIGN